MPGVLTRTWPNVLYAGKHQLVLGKNEFKNITQFKNLTLPSKHTSIVPVLISLEETGKSLKYHNNENMKHQVFHNSLSLVLELHLGYQNPRWRQNSDWECWLLTPFYTSLKIEQGWTKGAKTWKYVEYPKMALQGNKDCTRQEGRRDDEETWRKVKKHHNLVGWKENVK